jgi:transcription antitermination factor NusA-like protein
MIKHHRQQDGDMHALHGHFGENVRRIRNQLGGVRADQR